MAKKYKIRAKFVFDGQVIVQAASRQEAEKHFVATLGRVESLDESIQDWDFSMKGNTVVNRKWEETEL